MMYQATEEKYFLRWAIGYQKDLSYDAFKQQLKAPSRDNFMNHEDTSTDKAIETVKNILNNMRV